MFSMETPCDRSASRQCHSTRPPVSVLRTRAAYPRRRTGTSRASRRIPRRIRFRSLQNSQRSGNRHFLTVRHPVPFHRPWFPFHPVRQIHPVRPIFDLPRGTGIVRRFGKRFVLSLLRSPPKKKKSVSPDAEETLQPEQKGRARADAPTFPERILCIRRAS